MGNLTITTLTDSANLLNFHREENGKMALVFYFEALTHTKSIRKSIKAKHM